MKKIGLAALLILLVAIEIYLLTALLPMQWQLALQRFLPETHDYADVTHPALAHEIDQVLHNHVGIRVTFYAILFLLIIANTFLLVKTWKTLRHSGKYMSAP